MKNAIGYTLLATILLLALGEFASRYILGLGTPPLTITHDKIEYLFAPNQDVRRFGNRQLYNEYGMRSVPLEDWGDARRIIVFGDSVLNGGNLTDHARLGTTIATNVSDNAIFANVSAGSWGPGNVLGYVNTFGLFEANTVILVFSSGDAGDPPEFQPLNPNTHPTEPPVSALVEGWTRYAPRYLPSTIRERVFSKPFTLQASVVNPPGLKGVEALPLLLGALEESATRVCVVLHSSRSELREARHEFKPIEDAIGHFNVPIVYVKDILYERGSFEDIFRDEIHINDLGQQVLADALVSCDGLAEIPKK